MKLPSKELLKVLGYKEETYLEIVQNAIMDDNNYPSLNDLAHRVKEWVIINGYELAETQFMRNSIPYFDMRVEGEENGVHCCMYEFNHKPEFEYYNEAIFTAGDWVLKQLEDKNDTSI